jgi:hypothetical protein
MNLHKTKKKKNFLVFHFILTIVRKRRERELDRKCPNEFGGTNRGGRDVGEFLISSYIFSKIVGFNPNNIDIYFMAIVSQ